MIDTTRIKEEIISKRMMNMVKTADPVMLKVLEVIMADIGLNQLIGTPVNYMGYFVMAFYLGQIAEREGWYLDEYVEPGETP